MSSWVAITGRICCITSRVVKADVTQCDGVSTSDVKAVNRIILDVQIREHCIFEVFGNNEVVRPVN